MPRKVTRNSTSQPSTENPALLEYERGKIKITGSCEHVVRLIYIDLVTSKLFWIARFIAYILGLGYARQICEIFNVSAVYH
jgi:hypothetical protein